MLVKTCIEQKKSFSWTNLSLVRCLQAYDYLLSYSSAVLCKKYMNLLCRSEPVVLFALVDFTITNSVKFSQK